MSLRAPYMPPDQLECLLKDHFPLQSVDVNSIKEFDGYADRNYYFSGELKDSYSSAVNTQCCKEFVVKFVNSKESMDIDIIHGIGELTEFLYHRSFDCPFPITGSTSINDSVVILKHSDILSYLRRDKSQLLIMDNDNDTTNDVQYCIRLSLFVKGGIFGHGEQPSSLLHELGAYVGRMNKELKDFSNDGIANRTLLYWDLKQFLHHRDIIPAAITDNVEQADILHNIIKDFEEHVIPLVYDAPDVERGYIHNDINCLNIIVNNDPTTGSPYISGLIDFSNTVFAPLVFELGISMAYLMMRRQDCARYINPFLKGYLSVIPLSKTSLNVLYYVVLARLAQSYLNGMYAHKMDPSNKYVLVETTPGWNLIKDLLKEGKDNCYRVWGI